MYDRFELKIIEEAKEFIKEKSTIRKVAGKLKTSKSTLHKHLTVDLPDISYPDYVEVRKIIDLNKAERHIRGGMATKLKYLSRK